MCGIAGFVDYQKITDENILAQVTEVLHHRGPDDTGYYFDKQDNYYIGLGHKRLSVIDISDCGHQPMHFEELTIIYNGEIYNYQAIQQELLDAGYTFESTSDTEVALKSFHCWGMQALSKFIGMFAIALYNKNTNELFLVRDRIGVKPLYYLHDQQRCVFGSELKSIMSYPGIEKKIDKDVLNLYLFHGYITSPLSIFKHVRKVQPGTYIRLHNRQVSTHVYWNLKEKFSERRASLINDKETALQQLDTLVTSAVQYRMVADVPVGAFLSGGYDSSLVAAIMQKLSTTPIKSFTIGFHEEDYNEANHARRIAEYLKTDHCESYFHTEEALNLIEKIPQYFDEPFADSSQLPTMLVSQLAREKVTVILSGDGGDELFCGYAQYDEAAHYWRYQKLFKAASLVGNRGGGRLLNLFDVKYKKLLHLDSIEHIVNHRYLLSQYYMKGLVKDTDFVANEAYTDALSDNIQEAFMLQDMLTYLPDDVMAKVDRATMSVSLEGREPLLDHRLFEYSFDIAHDLKCRNGEKKYLLKQLTHQYIPKSLLDRPKRGFSLPMHIWLKKELKFLVEKYLAEEYILAQGIFDDSVLRSVLREFENEKVQGKYASLVWNLIVFQLWYQKYCSI